MGWVLWAGSVGFIALACVVGAKAVGSAVGALLHYVLIISAVGVVIWLLSFPMGAIGGRVGFGRFVRAVSSSQAVALSTQYSLASLPAMLRGAEKLDIPVKASGIVLPLAVAIFRFPGPAMNLAVVIYIRSEEHASE